ncbi:MAB_1171c family putative transporter [Amycolatopsis sp. NPDC005003]
MIDAATAQFDILFPICALASFVALLYKLRDLRRDRGNAALRALCAGRASTALAYVFLTPALFTRLDAALGTHNLGALLSNSCIILSALTSQVMLLYWFHSPEVARRRARWVSGGYLTVVGVMAGLFVLSAPSGEHPVDFMVHFATNPEVAAYVVVYLGAYGANLINTARRTWSSSPVIVSRPWLQRGLRLTALGCVFVLGYFAGNTLGVVGRWAGTGALDFASVLLAPILASVGSLVLVLGSTFPRWGRRITTRLSRIRSLRRIHPLWYSLCEAVPGITLYGRRSPRPPWLVRDIEIRLYRTIIEIHDGRRALRPYRDRRVARSAEEAGHRAGLTGDELRAVVEAATLKAALRKKLDGADQYDEEGTAGGTEAPAEADLGGELAWLEQVALAFTAAAPDGRIRTGTAAGDGSGYRTDRR